MDRQLAAVTIDRKRMVDVLDTLADVAIAIEDNADQHIPSTTIRSSQHYGESSATSPSRSKRPTSSADTPRVLSVNAPLRPQSPLAERFFAVKGEGVLGPT